MFLFLCAPCFSDCQSTCDVGPSECEKCCQNCTKRSIVLAEGQHVCCCEQSNNHVNLLVVSELQCVDCKPNVQGNEECACQDVNECHQRPENILNHLVCNKSHEKGNQRNHQQASQIRINVLVTYAVSLSAGPLDTHGYKVLMYLVRDPNDEVTHGGDHVQYNRCDVRDNVRCSDHGVVVVVVVVVAVVVAVAVS